MVRHCQPSSVGLAGERGGVNARFCMPVLSPRGGQAGPALVARTIAVQTPLAAAVSAARDLVGAAAAKANYQAPTRRR
jgi:hypothetical protein